MKTRNLFFAITLCGVAFISPSFSGCASNPPDVWTLLAMGETEQAMSFFLGEVDVNDSDRLGRTPLHLAAENRNPALASFFIHLGANVNAVDNNGISPLGISANLLDERTANVLVAAGADIHHPTLDNISPAQIAVESGNEAFLAALLVPSAISSTDSSGKNILHLAVYEGNVRAVHEILSSGGTVQYRDNSGRNALDMAYTFHHSRDHGEIAERLIQSGAVSDNPFHTHFAPAARTLNYNIRSADGMAPLHYIARSGYLGFLNFALQRGAQVNIQNASGSTPLHEAVRTGNIEVMEILLNNGADVNAQDANGNTALHIGVPPAQHLRVLNFLLSRGANPNLQDNQGASALHVAVTINRSNGVVLNLLLAGAEVSIRDVEGKTPLFLAVEKSRMDLIPLLLALGSEIFAEDNNGLSPFALAIKTDMALVFALIDAGTVTQRDSAGNTMLHVAVSTGGGVNVLNAILSFNANNDIVNARNYAGDTSLAIAVRLNRREAGELLLHRGADIFAVNSAGESPLSLTFPHAGGNPAQLRRWMLTPHTLAARDGLGNSLLHFAAQWRLDQWIPLLIQLGANTEAANATGATPLFSAVMVDSPSTIRVLTTNGAHLTARDTLGNSLLHAAVRWHAIAGAEMLISLGVDINSRALNGKTPLHDSIRLGMPQAQALLLRRGADMEARDAEGNTPLMEAIFAGNYGVMHRLTGMGANPNTRNLRGDTPLHSAVVMERSDMIVSLLSLGVSIHARNSLGRTPFQNVITSSPHLLQTIMHPNRIHSVDDDGSSPLHIAIAERVPLETITAIMALGVNLSTVDSEGRIPVRLSVELGAWEISRLLADSGSDVFAAAVDGRSAADISLSVGYQALRSLFSGAAINATDISGNTILHHAARHGDTAVINQLLSLGAFREARNIAAERPFDIALRWNNGAAAALLN